jgi:regulator of replication initiation timing
MKIKRKVLRKLLRRLNECEILVEAILLENDKLRAENERLKNNLVCLKVTI